MGRIYDDITQIIGNTPLVKLNRITKGSLARVGVNEPRLSEAVELYRSMGYEI